MHIEVVRGAPAHRGHVLPKAELHYTPSDEELHYSLFGMDQAIYAHLAATRSTENFTGAYHADFLYFIVRRELDLGGALHAVRRLVGRLYDRFGVSAAGLLLYYSGGWGFHVGLPQRLFGGFDPGPALPVQLNALSQRVLAECFGLEEETLACLAAGGADQQPPRHFADVVPDLYEATRLLRAPNSRNAAGGCYKIPLHAPELLTLTGAQLRTLAGGPRPDFVPWPQLADQPASAALSACWRQVRGLEPRPSSEPSSEISAPPGEQPFFGPVTARQGAAGLAAQARVLAGAGLSRPHVSQLLTVLNRASGFPLPAAEVARLVADAVQQAPRWPERAGSVIPYQGLPWAGPDAPVPGSGVRHGAQRPICC